MPDRPGFPQSSRGRYRDYRRRVRAERPKNDGPPELLGHADGQRSRHGKSTRRSRSFFALLAAFWGLLRGHRATLGAAMCTLSVSTLLGLLPLYGTKLV